METVGLSSNEEDAQARLAGAHGQDQALGNAPAALLNQTVLLS